MSRVADPTARISLLRAAEEVFAKKGLEAAKVEEIARLAGVSKGAFYLHFEGKEEAFLHVVEAFLARCRGMLQLPTEEAVEAARANAAECGVAETVELYEFLWQNRAILAILHTCKGSHAYLFEAFHRDLHANARAWVLLFVRAGIYRADLDPDLVATLLVGAYNELAKAMLASERRPPLREWLLATHEVFFRGLTADPAAAPQAAPPSRVSLPSLETAPTESPRARARRDRTKPKQPRGAATPKRERA